MTRLFCSDYKCTRTTVESYHRRWGYDSANKPPKAELDNILCRVHAGGLKRSKYRDDPIPLTDKDRERLLKEQAKVDEERRIEAEARAEQSRERDIRYHAEAWASLDATPTFDIVKQKDRWTAEEDPEPIFYGRVFAAGTEPDRYDDRWFSIEPSQRNYGSKGLRYPYGIRTTRGGDLTPNEARQLAYALQEAAAKAELLNEGRNEPA